ncbi:hypothetical protein EXU57_08250 [Segetibacter sp. 3557_3]|uniref:hypothetical protein n=1 Tax=Segetibacter sp. 3557_3 TaxID=2547429 RepID=UPI001058E57C|nr:hypothetical protein [Segetibacter sp. 3557_3]TDH26793.1 hypothetical protein EXU57_08250 [Segetibacter sp. 3557_3]
MDIKSIRFRTLDTIQLLKGIELKKQPAYTVREQPARYSPAINRKAELAPPEVITTLPKVERVLIKTMKVPFDALSFQSAQVSFAIFIEELQKEVKFTIANPNVREEFEAIKQYFANVFKKKLVTVTINIRYHETEIISTRASSDDIDKIDQSLIESVRFEFVKREVFSPKVRQDLPLLYTAGNIIGRHAVDAAGLYPSDQALINDLLSIKGSKHYDHLQYLSSQHLSSILKVRFILEPFSFLFLLQGDTQYHMVWETLNTAEATYIWHFEKSIGALRNGLTEIEAILQEIKRTGKQDYLRKEQLNLSRVIHDYNDPKKGFVQWKAALEQKLV